MDRRLLELLACPATRQPLHALDAATLAALNAEIAHGTLQRADGQPQREPIREALATPDGQRVYRVDDGIPVLLVEEGIATAQADDFPAP